MTGRIERGIIKVGEEIEIVGIKPTLKTTCTGVEMFRKLLTRARLATTSASAARHQARRSRARPGAASWLHQAAHPLHR